MMKLIKNSFLALVLIALSAQVAWANWSDDWSVKQKISIVTTDATEAINDVPVLLRLHSGNFDFTGANLDGSDLRFIAADDKTELKFYVEKFDSANELAVVWVMVPQVSAANKDLHIWMYTGNENATATSSVAGVKNPKTVASFEFNQASLLKDSSATGLVASGNINTQKAGLIGEGALFNAEALVVPASPALDITSGATWSAWVKPTSLPQSAKLFQSGDLSLNLDGSALVLSAAGASAKGGELKPEVWQHVALVVQADKVLVYLNGAEIAQSVASNLKAGAEFKLGEGFVGEMDQFEIANAPRSASWMAFLAKSQGVDTQLVKVELAAEGEEGEGEANYFSILLNSLTIDAKVVIAILAVMFAISAWVMYSKAVLVSKTDKGNAKFLARFQKANTDDLLKLDKGDDYDDSTLFGLYKAGLREIKKREQDGKVVLSGASIDAIKAAVDADLVRETQRMNSLMVLLTIAISGGPFLGLLGTVVGVMITFAAIAAAGDVNVNAIAPGIAAALLATVAGLAVAIPALFGYNYLASRIKNITIAMQIFVDEFITRTAEVYGKD